MGASGHLRTLSTARHHLADTDSDWWRDYVGCPVEHGSWLRGSRRSDFQR